MENTPKHRLPELTVKHFALDSSMFLRTYPATLECRNQRDAEGDQTSKRGRGQKRGMKVKGSPVQPPQKRVDERQWLRHIPALCGPRSWNLVVGRLGVPTRLGASREALLR